MRAEGEGWCKLKERAANVMKAADLPSAPPLVFAERADVRVPLIAFVGGVNTGKSSVLNAILGKAVGAVADRDHSSHPIFIGYDTANFYGYRMVDGTEIEVAADVFLEGLSFGKDGQRDETVANGIVRLPLPQLRTCEFVDLPGLGGRYGSTLDPVTLDTAARCPMAIITFTKLGADALKTVCALVEHGVSTLCLRTKADLELRGDFPETLRDVQFQELSDMLERNVVTVIALVTIKNECSGRYGVLDASVLGNRLDLIANYYVVARACAKIRGDVIRLNDPASSLHAYGKEASSRDDAARTALLSSLNAFVRTARYPRKPLRQALGVAIGGSRWYELERQFGSFKLAEFCTPVAAAAAIEDWLRASRRGASHNEWVQNTLVSLERTYVPLAHNLHIEAAATLALGIGDGTQARWLRNKVADGRSVLSKAFFMEE